MNDLERAVRALSAAQEALVTAELAIRRTIYELTDLSTAGNAEDEDEGPDANEGTEFAENNPLSLSEVVARSRASSATDPAWRADYTTHGDRSGPLARIASARPCLDAETTDADLAQWARTTIIPTLEEEGVL